MSSLLPIGTDTGQQPSSRSHDYVVVARRYRPQTFDELIGQGHVAKALSNAISSRRVGHAYLFAGARGVGKTSAARILAKALNCVTGPSPTPCNRCDVCQAISAGEDVDVLEIDGASNRGIDEIRQLRQNVNIRPSRERFKIYIIDEVHMLTREAFNALLKTLEEPPEHVKFIFCTTEPTKIPVTILSRCQRFDFAAVETGAIVKRLGQIVEAEGVAAEPEALQLLARRAAGSMRDSQSLLEQLLAFAPQRITLADVNAVLGIAGNDRLVRLARLLIEGNTAGALVELNCAIQEGIDCGLLVEQLLGFYRDIMVAAAGCSADLFLHATPDQWQDVADFAKRLGVENVLAVMQILDQTLARLRYSTQARILAELALVRIATLGDVVELGNLVAQLQSGSTSTTANRPDATPSRGATPSLSTLASHGATPSHGAASRLMPEGEAVELKKKVSESTPDLGSQTPPESSASGRESIVQTPLTPDNAHEIWMQVVERTPGLVGDHARHFAHVASRAPNHLAITFSEAYTFSRSICDTPEQRGHFERILNQLTGQRVRLEFLSEQNTDSRPEAKPVTRGNLVYERRAKIAQHPMVRRAMELFEAVPERIDGPTDGSSGG